jgi:hypothetical protein
MILGYVENGVWMAGSRKVVVYKKEDRFGVFSIHATRPNGVCLQEEVG